MELIVDPRMGIKSVLCFGLRGDFLNKRIFVDDGGLEDLRRLPKNRVVLHHFLCRCIQ